MTLLNPNLIKFLAYKGGCNVFVFEIIDEHFRHYESDLVKWTIPTVYLSNCKLSVYN